MCNQCPLAAFLRRRFALCDRVTCFGSFVSFASMLYVSSSARANTFPPAQRSARPCKGLTNHLNHPLPPDCHNSKHPLGWITTEQLKSRPPCLHPRNFNCASAPRSQLSLIQRFFGWRLVPYVLQYCGDVCDDCDLMHCYDVRMTRCMCSRGASDACA